LVGIHVWANWNGHDYAFAERMGAIRDNQADGIDLYSMDANEPSNNLLIGEWDVRNLPAFVVFQEGRRLHTFYKRLESVDELVARILRWLECLAEPP